MKISRVASITLAAASLAALTACSNGGGMGDMFGGSSTAAAAPAQSLGQPGLSQGMVKQVQTALKQQGAYNGNIDGVWGTETQSAVRSYQQGHNLTPNGKLDAQTLQALNIPSTGMNSNTAGNMNNNMNTSAPGSSNPPAVSGGTATTPPPNNASGTNGNATQQ